ncbi:type 11 methyltransferase [Mucor ambiguus]|uniref:Type 11 methyltransferase n=1 Tax=Mucor ambiguus TaxID=91626 RepID=A0A0C9N4K7_9FUNG|nr:type 11 methyltransferase [Mucor ambiguus]
MSNTEIDTDTIKSQLNSLELLRSKTQALVDCKATLLSKTEILDSKKNLLEETNVEKQKLQRERKLLREMLQNITKDLTAIADVEQSLAKESEELERSVNKMRTEQYDPLHEQVNEIRVQNGMSKLPHIQQELEAQMAKTLEDRRMKWQQEESSSKRKTKHQKSYSNSTLASGATDYNRYNILDQEDTVINAAAMRVNQRYEQEKVAILQERSSCAPCIISQHPEFSSRKDLCDDTTSSIYTSSTTITHSSSPPSLAESSVATTGNMTHQRNPSQYSDWLRSSGTSTIRKKVTSQEVMLNLFIQPNSEVDRRKEKDRQQRLHYLLKRIWQGIYRADLKDPEVIVNWCCGIGLWDMEMAALFPDAKVIGVDYKEATLSNLLHGIPNLEFRFAVIHDTYTGLESFEDDSVDFVILRDTWLMNAPVWKWDNLFKAIYRILKPGGWIEVEEHSLVVDSEGPCSRKLHAWFDVFFNEIQVDRNIAKKLGGHLVRAGFVDINKQSITIPLGEWCSTESLRETGFLFKDLIERRVRVLSKWICQLNNLDMKYMNETITIVMDEEIDQYHSSIDWISYTARKASTTPCNMPHNPTALQKEKHPFSSLRIDSSNTTPPPPSPPPPSVA